MTIEKAMSSNVVTIAPSNTLVEAVRVMKEKKIKHLPVVDASGSVVGVVTDRDLKEASASDATTLEVHELLYLLDKVKIDSIMSKNVITIEKGSALKQAAQIMVEKGIGCLPIVEGNKLSGIITRSDILRFFATS
ncbi:MAG TPA: CBS domain-containing protein [Pusillimonas sp.]|uniref:CBS domain-containing protein n=1 Tax=unclassified Pusillimonas TaxID=2640016 RepID=UPI00261EBC91|nr:MULTISPECIES: CBS domain-containing protein [unclassified Pusillimonas]HLU20462.1 CBS domain-containing protein [Pusillimonas sp.]